MQLLQGRKSVYQKRRGSAGQPKEPEVSANNPDALMEDVETMALEGRNRGSKYRKVTKLDRVNSQLKEQERLADTAQALAALL